MPPGRQELQADVYDTLASLYRHQHQYDHAIRHAQQALALREEMGDLLRVANSFNNLGLIYNDMGDFDHAIAAYQEAMATYQKLENRGLTAGTLLNIGMAYHLDGRLAPAIQTYQECLAVCQEIGLPLVEVRAHYNLAEAYAQMEQPEPARHHWRVGYQLSLRAGFDDEAEDFLALQQQWPILQGQTDEPLPTPRQPSPAGPPDWQLLELDEVERCALALEQELAAWLKADVRLLPEVLLSARPALSAPRSGLAPAGPGSDSRPAGVWPTTQVVWVWQADWIQG